MKVFKLFLFLRKYLPIFEIGSQVALVVNNLPANAGDIRDLTLIPGVEKTSCSRKWQATPVFLPGEPHEQRSLVGYSPWGHKELDTTEAS